MKKHPQNNLNLEAKSKIRIGDHVVLSRRGKRQIWTAEFHYSDQNGQRQHGRKSLRTRNARVAEQRAKELDELLCSREYEPKSESTPPVSIDEAIKSFIKAKETDGCAPKTLIKYSGELANFARFLKDNLRIEALSAIAIQHADLYKTHRKEIDGLDSYTLQNHLIILKTWLKWCRKRGLIASILP